MSEEQKVNSTEGVGSSPSTNGEASPATELAKKKCTLKTWHMFLLGLIGLLLVVVLAAYAVVVKATRNMSENSWVLKTAKILQLPAAKINGTKVLYTDYLDDLNTLKRFYKNKPEGFPDATPEQISDQVISRLVANKLINENATKYNVVVTSEEINKFKEDLLKQFPDTKKAEEELADKYGWTMDIYLQKVVEPILKEQKLQAAFASSTDETGKAFEEQEIHARHILFMVNKGDNDATIKAKAQKVLDRIKAGEDFAKLAKEFGSDSTKDNGGDLGWFGKGQMVPEFEQAIFSIEPGKVGDQLVKTQFGYHIVKVEGKRVSRNFLAYMDQQLKKAQIKILININDPFAKLKNPTVIVPEGGVTSTDNSQ